jgi:iron complex transport system permease protein
MDRKRALLGLLLVLMVLSILFAISFGTADIPFDQVMKLLLKGITGIDLTDKDNLPGWETIVIDIRLPLVIMAMFVGAGLSSSGASLQGLFKNPLVDPFIIGISAGGAFGWVIALIITIDMTGDWVNWFRALMSFIGAITTVSIAYLVARTGTKVPLTNLLLAGVAISASLTAGTQFGVYMFIENPRPLLISLLGTCSGTTWEELWIVGPVVTICILGLSFLSKDLNAFSMGEEEARGLGVNVERSKILILGLASLMAAVTVPFCGMIGFVGLMIPHIVRRFTGPDHRYMVPASALLGASFLIFSDLLSRTVMGTISNLFEREITDQIIPLGIITGLVGGIFFLYLLVSRRGKV